MKTAAETKEFTDQIKLAAQGRSAGTLSAEERERLILEHLPQVRLVARRIHSRLPGNVSLDDLISTGTVGLISAIDKFDPSRNLQMKTYAEHKIRGAILDSLRRMDWAPRQQRKRAKQVRAAIAVVEQRLQGPAPEEAIATELDLTMDGYHKWQVELGALNLGRLESVGSQDSEDRDLLNSISNDASEWPSAQFERNELQRVLASAISEIPEVEKTVLGLYYHEELTLREIALILNLHESCISQIRSQAVLRLRVGMAKLWPAAGRDAVIPDKRAVRMPRTRKPATPVVSNLCCAQAC